MPTKCRCVRPLRSAWNGLLSGRCKLLSYRPWNRLKLLFARTAFSTPSQRVSRVAVSVALYLPTETLRLCGSNLLHKLFHDGQCAPDSRLPSQICYLPDSSTPSGWSSVCKTEDKRASPIQDLKSGYTSTIQNLAPVPAHVRCIHPESHGAVSNPME